MQISNPKSTQGGFCFKLLRLLREVLQNGRPNKRHDIFGRMSQHLATKRDFCQTNTLFEDFLTLRRARSVLSEHEIQDGADQTVCWRDPASFLDGEFSSTLPSENFRLL